MLHNLKASWWIMKAMDLGLSGATCNRSVIPDALLGVRDDGDNGGI